MKQNMILLFDSDVNTSAAVLTAAGNAGFDVRFARLQPDCSGIFQSARGDIAAIVLDYDPDLHGPAIMETLERWFPARPIILISKAEDLQHPMVVAGANTKHLIKPVTAGRFANAIESLVHEPGCPCISCDRWGHPLTEEKPAKLVA
jgi:DNA-binding NtrC family response regulator